MKVSETKMEKS